MHASKRAFSVLLVGAAVTAVGLACGLGSAAPVQQSAPISTPVDISIDDLNTQIAQATLFAQASGAGSGPQATGTPAMETLPAPTPVMQLPTAVAQPPSAVVPQPEITEARRLTLEYPSHIRVGDSETVRLTLEVDTLGNILPTAEIQGNTIAGQVVQIPNLFDTHNVMAEARLDMAGPEIKPDTTVDEALLPGQSVTFFWSVHPTQAGTFNGTVWFYLKFVDKQTGAVSQKTISAQPVRIQATDLFGLSGNLARVTGGLGSVLGFVLGLPFLDDVLKWLWGRFKPKP